MKLSRYTDYALRVLIQLATQPDRLISISQIAATYDISQNHLMKIVQDLGRAGFVETQRGRNGGLRLGRPPIRSPSGRWFATPKLRQPSSIAAPA